jgi:predicted helicase
MSLNNNWMQLSENDWSTLPALISKEVNQGDTEAAIFKFYSRGIEAGGDDWIYDITGVNLERNKVYSIDLFDNSETIQVKNAGLRYQPKSDKRKVYNKENLLTVAFRPFCKLYFYLDEHHINKPGQWFKKKNSFIVINSPGSTQDFFCLTTDCICDVHFTGDNLLCIPLFSYTNEETLQDNITDWAFQLFNNHYRQNEPSSPVCYAGSSELRTEFLLDIPIVNPITKEAIFHYVYAVLHHPVYRKKYEINLKQESPRIPLYNNFQQWAAWGKRLAYLHINYQTVTAYPLERRDVVIEPTASMNLDSFFNAKLKASKEEGKIDVDAFITLSDIPKNAWDYKPGNRSALEWILGQYKENKPGNDTITEQIYNYRFSDYKEQVIDLLKRVCTVSVETMELVREMP